MYGVFCLRTRFSISAGLPYHRFLQGPQNVGNLGISERRRPRWAEKFLAPSLWAPVTTLGALVQSFGRSTDNTVVSCTRIHDLGQQYLRLASAITFVAGCVHSNVSRCRYSSDKRARSSPLQRTGEPTSSCWELHSAWLGPTRLLRGL
jgi:hypothetical protein